MLSNQPVPVRAHLLALAALRVGRLRVASTACPICGRPTTDSKGRVTACGLGHCPNLRSAGDVVGHEFHGNQWTTGTGPMAGEKSGVHTKEAAGRMKDYLEKETGLQIAVHGSLGKGAASSANDMDLAVVDPTAKMSSSERDAYEQKMSDEANQAQSDIQDRIARGEITQDEGMQQLYGDQKDPVVEAMARIGFKPTKEMSWMGISVVRFHNERTKHTVELWGHGGDSGNAEDGPPTMRSRNLARHKESALHATADAHYKPMFLTISAAFMRGKKAYKSGGIDAAVKTIRASLLADLPAVLTKTLQAGGMEAVTMLERQLRFAELRSAELRTAKVGDKSPLRFRFDVKNERATKWAREHAAELAKGISETSRERIQAAVARAQEEGGLDEMYDDILDAVGSEARADMIARTESMTAANEGNREGWRQAVDEGLLTGNERVVWIATDGACPEICAPMDGETRALDDEDYDGQEPPPAHPNCRCTEGLSA